MPSKILELRRKVSGSFNNGNSLTYVRTNWSGIDGKPLVFPPAGHSHSISQVTGLQGVLDGKAASTHNHPISQVTGLQSALNGKLNTSGGTLTGALTSNDSILMPFRGTAGTDRIYQEFQGVSANDSTNENSGAFIRFRTSTSAGYGADIGAYRRSGAASALIIKTGGQNPTESVRIDENKNLIVQGTITSSGQAVILNNDYRLTNSRPASDVQSWAKSSQALTSDMYLKVNANSASWINAATLKSDLSLATVATSGSYNDLSNKPGLGNLSDVNLTVPTPSNGDVLTFNGVSWQADAPTGITGAASTVVTSNLTANRAVISNGSGKIAVSAITSTELGYLDGVTSNIQEQIDGKWKLIYTGPTSALSKTSSTMASVPTDTYVGRTIAFEIRYGNSTLGSYTNAIVHATIGNNSSTAVSSTYPRFVGISNFNGQHLINISTKCYVNTTGSTSVIYFGYVKTLVGDFSGSTIDWTTQASDTISVYIGKIWVLD